MSPRYDLTLPDFEKWTNSVLPSRQFGHLVISTNQGIYTHEEARRRHIGGKIVGFFYWRWTLDPCIQNNCLFFSIEIFNIFLAKIVSYKCLHMDDVPIKIHLIDKRYVKKMKFLSEIDPMITLHEGYDK